MADIDTFDRVAVEWYVRVRAVPRLRRSGYNDKEAEEELLVAARDPLKWKDDVIRYIDGRSLFQRYRRIKEDESANAEMLLANVRKRMKLPIFDEDGEACAARLKKQLLSPPDTPPSPQQANATLVRSIIGCLLAETQEDEAMGVLSSDETDLPLSVWPLVLKRAWKKEYSAPGVKGRDAVYHLLRNSPALQRGMRAADELDPDSIESMILEIRSNCARLGISSDGVDLLDRFRGILRDTTAAAASTNDIGPRLF